MQGPLVQSRVQGCHKWLINGGYMWQKEVGPGMEPSATSSAKKFEVVLTTPYQAPLYPSVELYE